jgi:hypothetical protein
MIYDSVTPASADHAANKNYLQKMPDHFIEFPLEISFSYFSFYPHHLYQSFDGAFNFPLNKL